MQGAWAKASLAREPVLKDSLVANLVQHFYLSFKKENQYFHKLQLKSWVSS